MVTCLLLNCSGACSAVSGYLDFYSIVQFDCIFFTLWYVWVKPEPRYGPVCQRASDLQQWRVANNAYSTSTVL